MKPKTKLDIEMKRKKFNGDYAGEIILVGFTGNADRIQDYLKTTFKIKMEGELSVWSHKEKFNIEVADEVLAHVETYTWTNRKGLQISDISKDGSVKITTVREMIHLLLERNMDDEVIARDEGTGERIHNVELSTRDSPGLGCLFG